MSIIQWHEENFRRWILGKRLRLAKYTQPLISQTNRKDHLSLYHSVQESGIATVWGLQSIPKLLYTVQQCQYSVFAPEIYYTLPSTFKKKKCYCRHWRCRKKEMNKRSVGKYMVLLPVLVPKQACPALPTLLFGSRLSDEQILVITQFLLPVSYF